MDTSKDIIPLIPWSFTKIKSIIIMFMLFFYHLMAACRI